MIIGTTASILTEEHRNMISGYINKHFEWVEKAKKNNVNDLAKEIGHVQVSGMINWGEWYNCGGKNIIVVYCQIMGSENSVSLVFSKYKAVNNDFITITPNQVNLKGDNLTTFADLMDSGKLAKIIDEYNKKQKIFD